MTDEDGLLLIYMCSLILLAVKAFTSISLEDDNLFWRGCDSLILILFELFYLLLILDLPWLSKSSIFVVSNYSLGVVVAGEEFMLTNLISGSN